MHAYTYLYMFISLSISIHVYICMYIYTRTGAGEGFIESAQKLKHIAPHTPSTNRRNQNQCDVGREVVLARRGRMGW